MTITQCAGTWVGNFTYKIWSENDYEMMGKIKSVKEKTNRLQGIHVFNEEPSSYLVIEIIEVFWYEDMNIPHNFQHIKTLFQLLVG